jgi:hypothetical protein
MATLGGYVKGTIDPMWLKIDPGLPRPELHHILRENCGGAYTTCSPMCPGYTAGSVADFAVKMVAMSIRGEWDA